jgi:hypothetical protein
MESTVAGRSDLFIPARAMRPRAASCRFVNVAGSPPPAAAKGSAPGRTVPLPGSVPGICPRGTRRACPPARSMARPPSGSGPVAAGIRGGR